VKTSRKLFGAVALRRESACQWQGRGVLQGGSRQGKSGLDPCAQAGGKASFGIGMSEVGDNVSRKAHLRFAGKRPADASVGEFSSGGKGVTMVTSIILINVARNKINEAAEQIAAIDGVSEAYSVSGKYDIIAVIRVSSNEELARLVTDKLLAIEAILKTETMLAFKVYSRHDLEAMFSIGGA